MLNFFKLGSTFSRKITKYFVRPEPTHDGAFLEEVVEISLSREGVYETHVSVGLTVLHCGHIVRHYNEMGCQCSPFTQLIEFCSY